MSSISKLMAPVVVLVKSSITTTTWVERVEAEPLAKVKLEKGWMTFVHVFAVKATLTPVSLILSAKPESATKILAKVAAEEALTTRLIFPVVLKLPAELQLRVPPHPEALVLLVYMVISATLLPALVKLVTNSKAAPGET